MLCAAIGRAAAQQMPLSPASLRAVLLLCWGDDLSSHSIACGGTSNGLRAARVHGASGAREEGALGFPSVFEVALPALARALAEGRGGECARIDALFALMAHMSDTNVYHRGGADGAATVRVQARAFMDAGGTANPGWRALALDCHRVFVEQRLSPGGAADLLAAACLVHAIATGKAQ
jgi:triphosphoribosyl-dephospho-CoA synthase